MLSNLRTLSAIVALLSIFVIGCPETSIIVARGDLALQPNDVVSFGVITLGMAKERELTLVNNNSQGEVSINSVKLFLDSQEGAVQIVNDPADYEVELGAGQTVAVILSYAPTVEGVMTGRLSVSYFDGQNSQERVVAITGLGAQPAVLMDPPVIDFAVVPVGNSPAKNARVVNAGLGEIIVTGVTLDEPALEGRFDVLPALGVTFPAIVASQGDIQLRVEYRADDEEAREAFFTVHLQTIGDLQDVLVIANDCERSANPSFDSDGDGYFRGICGGDCDDTNPNIHPGAPELRDGFDNDCDGVLDEGTTAFDDDGD